MERELGLHDLMRGLTGLEEDDELAGGVEEDDRGNESAVEVRARI